MSTLADVFARVRPDTKTFGPELKQQTQGPAADAGSSAGHKFGASMVSAVKKAAAALAIGSIFAAKAFLGPAIAQASDLNETASKSATIFGANAASIQAWAATANKSMGLTRQQAMESAASFGDMFQQLKIGGNQSREMSTRLTGLAADFASFHNADITEVLQAQSAAFRGEFDSIQRFVPAINAARVQEEALRATRKKSAKDLTEADKALATYNILLNDTKAAQGDFAKTSGGLANQQRILKANWSDLQATVGQALLPVITQLVTSINDKVIPALHELWATHGQQVIGWLKQMAANVGPGIGRLIDKVSSVDWPGVLARAKNILAELVPQLANAGRESSLLGDTLDVGAVVFKFLADNIDLVGKALPYVIGAFLVFKAAQAGANAAAVASMPLRVWEVVQSARMTAALRAHSAALAQNTAAQRVNTASTVAGTAAENTGILTRMRAVVATGALRVAELAKTVATGIATAAQWLLNIAMLPVTLIVVAIVAAVALLVLGIMWLWRNNEGFRNFVITAWTAIKAAFQAVVAWIVDVAIPFVVAWFKGWINAGREVAEFIAAWGLRIIGFVLGMQAKVSGAAVGMWDGIVASAKAAINKVISIWNSLDISLNIGPLPDWLPSPFGGKSFAVPDLFPDLPMLAKGGIVKARPGGTAAILAEAGEDEFAVPRSEMRRMIAEAVAAGGREIIVHLSADIAGLVRFVKVIVGDELDATGAAIAGGAR